MATLLEMELNEWVTKTPVEMREITLQMLRGKAERCRVELASYVEAAKALELLIRNTTAKVSYSEIPVLQDEPPPEITVTYCVSCKAGGDSAHKVCRYRTDTGINEGWWCDECYKNWKACP